MRLTGSFRSHSRRIAYIESELAKRRGGVLPSPEQLESAKPHDPYEELYAIAEEYKIKSEGKGAQEAERREERGDVVASMAMLTASEFLRFHLLLDRSFTFG